MHGCLRITDAVTIIDMASLAKVLAGLMAEAGLNQRELARATEGLPGAPVAQATISRLLNGRNRSPNPDTLRSLAWALGGTDEQRDGILTQLRTAAGLTAREPAPLSWPAGVDQLTDRQRRALQRVVNTTVAAFLDEQ